ncbi:hypothetical protein [Ochrobactrum sp. BTU1]|uniref:hypothetical protein n=1 Tax=Ochrobactrum sp. BTU1 TaxID=2840456 RepID=UPI001C047096|nr:hypothetical protein KMS41_16715 [Ochrobactrum sp. BTU1]
MRDKPAFPFEGGDNNGIEPSVGMSFRAYAAVKFMAAIIEADGIQYAERDAHSHASIAVLNADALIAALTRPTGGSNV